MFGIAVWHSGVLASGPGGLLVSATLDKPQRSGAHVDYVMLIRLVMIRQGEIDEHVPWSG